VARWGFGGPAKKKGGASAPTAASFLSSSNKDPSRRFAKVSFRSYFTFFPSIIKDNQLVVLVFFYVSLEHHVLDNKKAILYLSLVLGMGGLDYTLPLAPYIALELLTLMPFGYYSTALLFPKSAAY
jgi:hypothetical protein